MRAKASFLASDRAYGDSMVFLDVNCQPHMPTESAAIRLSHHRPIHAYSICYSLAVCSMYVYINIQTYVHTYYYILGIYTCAVLS